MFIVLLQKMLLFYCIHLANYSPCKYFSSETNQDTQLTFYNVEAAPFWGHGHKTDYFQD